MAGVRIEINKRDLSRIHGRLNTLANLTDHLKPALDEIGDYLVSETTQRFADSTAPDGTPWAPVKRGGKPLVDFGHLRDSIHPHVGKNEVEIGSNLKYAAKHQMGFGVIKRPFLGVNIQDEREIGNILIKNISRNLL